MALYRAKADGRGTFCFFREEMAQVVEARRILELDLRKALANEEFELFFQPLVDLDRDGYPHAKRCCAGIIRFAARFRRPIIPVAEDMGLMVVLGARFCARPAWNS